MVSKIFTAHDLSHKSWDLACRLEKLNGDRNNKKTKEVGISYSYILDFLQKTIYDFDLMYFLWIIQPAPSLSLLLVDRFANGPSSSLHPHSPKLYHSLFLF